METKELAEQAQMARTEEGTEECHEKMILPAVRLLHLLRLNAQQIKQGNGQLAIGMTSEIWEQIGTVCDAPKMVKQLFDFR
jgi:hypothetical protein